MSLTRLWLSQVVTGLFSVTILCCYIIIGFVHYPYYPDLNPYLQGQVLSHLVSQCLNAVRVACQSYVTNV